VRLAAASDSHAALRAAAKSLPNASRQNATNHIQYRYPLLKNTVKVRVLRTKNVIFASERKI